MWSEGNFWRLVSIFSICSINKMSLIEFLTFKFKQTTDKRYLFPAFKNDWAVQRWGNRFQSGRGMGYWKVLSSIMVDRKQKFLNSRRSGMTEAVTFCLLWQPFNSFCFEILSFFPLLPFFLFAAEKIVCGVLWSPRCWRPGSFLQSFPSSTVIVSLIQVTS